MKSGWMIFVMLISLIFFTPDIAFSHCDTLDGPVVQDARRAIQLGDIFTVYKWVDAKDEMEVWQSFEKAVAGRKRHPEETNSIDKQFFETIVRLHRESEGIDFSELKPAGTLPQAIAEADKALDTGSFRE